jgi:hypothetical protein
MQQLMPNRPLPKPLKVIDKLLRDELAAAATYEQAQQHVDNPETLPALEKNRESHATRSVMLAQLLRQAGATPSESAGPWGVFTKLVENAASFVNDAAVLKVLAEGEKHSTSLYQREVTELPGDALRAVHDHGLFEQQRTEDRIRELTT